MRSAEDYWKVIIKRSTRRCRVLLLCGDLVVIILPHSDNLYRKRIQISFIVQIFAIFAVNNGYKQPIWI